MATIAKFYLHDAATPNTGTMPSGAFIVATGGGPSEPTGARTARDATDVIGASQITATGTSFGGVSSQTLGLRRYVSRPLAARTFAAADGNWTFSYARSESNTLHNGVIHCHVYLWRPSTGLQVGTAAIDLIGATMASTSETTNSVTAAWSGTQAILDGDILLFEIEDQYVQGMATSYTTSFFYDGTTEASATSCASFVAPPAALTLFAAPATATPRPRVVGQAVQRAASRCWSKRPSGIFVPRLWTPEEA